MQALSVPPQQGIRGEYRVEFEHSLSPYGLRLARQKSTLGVCESNPLSA